MKNDAKEKELETATQDSPELTESVADPAESVSPDFSSEANPDRLAELERELEEAKQAQAESYNRMLRVQADFDNFRRRSRQDYEQACLFGGEELLKKILPVLDSLERATACFDERDPENGGWREGVELTLKQFQKVLQSEGLEAVEALNLPFDPQEHEAVLQEESAAVSVATVVLELQKGYKYKNKLIRPALVKVAVPAT